MKPTNLLFSKNFLSHHLVDFKLSNIPKIRLARDIIKGFVMELNSGKIEKLKEEEIASRFINDFFGNVLGFNYGNSNFWTLSEEVKTKVDGTKVDGALGYFSKNKNENDVRAVIEIKDAKTNLDEKQKRKDPKSAVSQAFEYASKMGDKCDWIIVSNFKEIRFYYKSQDKFQKFFLEELVNEEKLKELLYLFHIDRFIKKEKKSYTEHLYETSKLQLQANEKPIHIVDQIYSSVIRFKGLKYVNPNYLANIKPFNILNEYVFHYSFSNSTLLTINPKIYNLFLNLEFNNGEVIISKILKEELEKDNVIEYENKINAFIKFFNHSRINTINCIEDYNKIILKRKNVIGFSPKHMFHFSDEERLTKNIDVFQNSNCDCVVCNFKSFDFKHLLSKLKTAQSKNESINLEYAYGNYLVSSNNFKNAYNIYKSLSEKTKGKEGYEIEYFLSKLNMKYLSSLVQKDEQMTDSFEIKEEGRNIDLNKILYDEIEFSISDDVRNYLLEIKEEVLLSKIKDTTDELSEKIINLKKHHDNGNHNIITSNNINRLSENYIHLELHLNKNNIIYNVFHKYKLLSAKIFDSFLNSYLTQEDGLQCFNSFYLLEFILNVNPEDFQKSLKRIEVLELSPGSDEKIYSNITNLFSSYFDKYSFSNSIFKNNLLKEYLINHQFKSKYRNLITNSFTLLSKIKTPDELFAPLGKVIIDFLTVDDELVWHDLKEFEKFLLKKGDSFTSKQLIDILEIAIERTKLNNNKYQGLIKNSSISLNKFYPTAKFKNKQLVKRAVVNINLPYEWRIVSYLLLVSNEECTTILNKEIEDVLDEKFEPEIYDHLIRKKLYDSSKKKYFKKYLQHINENRGIGYKKEFIGEKAIFNNYIFFNFIILLNILEIERDDNLIKSFSNLESYELWLLNPKKFTYDDFDSKWVLAFDTHHILKNLKGINVLNEKIALELKQQYSQRLSEIYYKYLL